MLRKIIYVLVILFMTKSFQSTNFARNTSVVFKLAKERFSEAIASQFHYFPVWEAKFRARNVLQCSIICLSHGGTLCRFFEVQYQTCRVFSKPEIEDIERMDQGKIFYVTPRIQNKSQLNVRRSTSKFKNVSEIETNFRMSSILHYPQSKNCLSLLVSGYDWISGQKMCHNLGLHLVVIDSVYVKLSVIDLISRSSLKGKCFRMDHYDVWTAGISTNRSVFQWQPYENSTLIPIGYRDWMLGQPDNGAVTGCIKLCSNYQWDDFFCSYKFCIVCEYKLY